MTVRERMLNLMDDLLFVTARIARKEKPTSEELELLPKLAESIVGITRYAVIEPKKESD